MTSFPPAPLQAFLVRVLALGFALSCWTSESQATTAQQPNPAGLDWVSMAGGDFTMGSQGGKTWEKPEHRVRMSSFSMTRSEITVAQYRACVVSGACSATIERDTYGTACHWGRRDRHLMPVNCVSWHQAQTFCRWAGGTLPTEAQWEYAARNGSRSAPYPWGHHRPDCERAVMKTSAGATGCNGKGYSRKTWPVCSKPTGNNRFGVCDLAGNVFEWTADRFDGLYYEKSPFKDPPGPSLPPAAPAKTFYVVRGGSYVDNAANIQAFRRFRDPATNRKANVGIRCVR